MSWAWPWLNPVGSTWGWDTPQPTPTAPVTAQQFIADWPEFATYSIAKITMWLTAAQNYVDPFEWGGMATIGVELVAAHNLVIDNAASKAVMSGTIPVPSLVQSKAVGPVSVSYNTQAGQVPDGGNWNLSTYGTRFLELRSMFGAGGLQF